MEINWKSLIIPILVFLTTFILFFIEAIVHYNVGYKHKRGGRWKLVWPPGHDILIIAGTVAGFSLINSILVWILENKMSKWFQ